MTGPLRPTVVNTVGLATRLSGRYPMVLCCFVLNPHRRSRSSKFLFFHDGISYVWVLRRTPNRPAGTFCGAVRCLPCWVQQHGYDLSFRARLRPLFRPRGAVKRPPFSVVGDDPSLKARLHLPKTSRFLAHYHSYYVHHCCSPLF